MILIKVIEKHGESCWLAVNPDEVVQAMQNLNKRTWIIVGLAILAMSGTIALYQASDRAYAQMHGPGWRHHDFWQPGWMRRRHWRHGRNAEMQARMQRHWTFMHDGLPKEYDTARSTVAKTPPRR